MNELDSQLSEGVPHDGATNQQVSSKVPSPTIFSEKFVYVSRPASNPRL